MTLADGVSDALAGLAEVQQKATETTTAGYSLGQAVFGTMLVIALVFIVYALATNKPHAKEYLIAWIVVLVFCLGLKVFDT